MRTLAPLPPMTTVGHIAPTALPIGHGTMLSMLPSGADSYGGPFRRVLRMGDSVQIEHREIDRYRASWTPEGGGQTYPRRPAAPLGTDRADTFGAPRDTCPAPSPPSGAPADMLEVPAHGRQRPGAYSQSWSGDLYTGWKRPPGWHGYMAARLGAYARLYPPPETVRGPFVSPPYRLRLGDDVAPGAPGTSVTYPDILTSSDQVAVPALEPQDVWLPQGLRPSPYGNAPPVGAPMSPTHPVFIPAGLRPPQGYGATAPLEALLPAALRQSPWLYLGLGGGALLLLALVVRKR